eukprot:TRINITY_DN711_c0_g1_i1.p1 TRINITY_DN711_c0_g1~~TRINITY_DN711_c0_g1_i1.p1  ORF type:complete len:156 (+),score=71.31 TRINITY_DN711_c0_g1_i1:51-470(+)
MSAGLKFISVLFVILSFVCFSIEDYSVSANLKNEFGTPISLDSVQLNIGNWTVYPPKFIRGKSGVYVPGVFVASGPKGVNGSVTYTTQNNFVKCVFYFSNLESYSNYDAIVGPAPWIGGVDSYDGTTQVSVNYWLHEMC